MDFSPNAPRILNSPVRCATRQHTLQNLIGLMQGQRKKKPQSPQRNKNLRDFVGKS